MILIFWFFSTPPSHHCLDIQNTPEWFLLLIVWFFPLAIEYFSVFMRRIEPTPHVIEWIWHGLHSGEHEFRSLMMILCVKCCTHCSLHISFLIFYDLAFTSLFSHCSSVPTKDSNTGSLARCKQHQINMTFFHGPLLTHIYFHYRVVPQSMRQFFITSPTSPPCPPRRPSGDC